MTLKQRVTKTENDILNLHRQHASEAIWARVKLLDELTEIKFQKIDDKLSTLNGFLEKTKILTDALFKKSGESIHVTKSVPVQNETVSKVCDMYHKQIKTLTDSQCDTVHKVQFMNVSNMVLADEMSNLKEHSNSQWTKIHTIEKTVNELYHDFQLKAEAFDLKNQQVVPPVHEKSQEISMHDRVVLLEKKVSCLYEDFDSRSNQVWSEADPSTMPDLENRARSMERLFQHFYKEYQDDRICHQHGMDVLMYKDKKMDKALANIASL